METQKCRSILRLKTKYLWHIFENKQKHWLWVVEHFSSPVCPHITTEDLFASFLPFIALFAFPALLPTWRLTLTTGRFFSRPIYRRFFASGYILPLTRTRLIFLAKILSRFFLNSTEHNFWTELHACVTRRTVSHCFLSPTTKAPILQARVMLIWADVVHGGGVGGWEDVIRMSVSGRHQLLVYSISQ